VTRLKWKLVSVHLETVIASVQDRCTDEDILHYYPLAKTQQKKGQVA
jgi:hypothetical protein